MAVRDNVTYVVTDLSTADYQEYYNGFANRVLWPILHYRVDLAEFNRSDLTGYLRVNGLFADQLAKLLQARRRHLGARLPPDPARPGAAVARVQQPDRLLPPHPLPAARPAVHHPAAGAEPRGAVSHYDLVGFQTENDRNNYGRYLAMTGAHQGRDGTSYAVDGRVMRIGAFPVGIETKDYAAIAREAADSHFTREFKESLQGRKLVVGVDRLDYSKGIVHRIEGFGHFLETIAGLAQPRHATSRSRPRAAPTSPNTATCRTT